MVDVVRQRPDISAIESGDKLARRAAR